MWSSRHNKPITDGVVLGLETSVVYMKKVSKYGDQKAERLKGRQKEPLLGNCLYDFIVILDTKHLKNSYKVSMSLVPLSKAEEQGFRNVMARDTAVMNQKVIRCQGHL